MFEPPYYSYSSPCIALFLLAYNILWTVITGHMAFSVEYDVTCYANEESELPVNEPLTDDSQIDINGILQFYLMLLVLAYCFQSLAWLLKVIYTKVTKQFKLQRFLVFMIKGLEANVFLQYFVFIRLLKMSFMNSYRVCTGYYQSETPSEVNDNNLPQRRVFIFYFLIYCCFSLAVVAISFIFGCLKMDKTNMQA